MNFNDEVTITQTSKQILTMEIIEARYNLFEAIETYDKMDPTVNVEDLLNVIKARLRRLYLINEVPITNDFKEQNKGQELRILQEILKIKTYEDLDRARLILANWLYDKKLTRLDLFKVIKPHDAEADNEAYGFT